MTKTDPTQNPQATTADSKKYASFKHSFTDPWEDAEVELDFKFAKPTKSQVKRLQDTAVKKPQQASRNLLLDTIHPDQRAQLEKVLDDYPGVATSYSGAIIKAIGISADLGN